MQNSFNIDYDTLKKGINLRHHILLTYLNDLEQADGDPLKAQLQASTDKLSQEALARIEELQAELRSKKAAMLALVPYLNYIREALGEEEE